MRRAVFRAANSVLRDTHDHTLRDMIALTAIPAPTGEEGGRADWLAGRGTPVSQPRPMRRWIKYDDDGRVTVWNGRG